MHYFRRPCDPPNGAGSIPVIFAADACQEATGAGHKAVKVSDRILTMIIVRQWGA